MNAHDAALRSWSRRRRFWNGLTRLKFAAAEPLAVPVPTGNGSIGSIAFTRRYPEIPIAGLVVADRFPADELSGPVLRIIEAEELASRRFPPALPDLPPIPADAHIALDAAYPAPYRKLYRTPSRPAGYDPIDLGLLAAASPYAYLLERRGDRLVWDLSVLDRFELQPGVRSPAVIVDFTEHQVDGQRALRASAIRCELGDVEPDDDRWPAAQRIAMCAAATHITLVRHFNWIHLVGGERFALATNRLPGDHTVRRLLAPHVYATHFGNRIVTPIQLAPGGDFEALFSYTHSGLCALFEATAVTFDLQTMDPRRDAELRAVADLQPQVLENRGRLMGVISRHVGDYLRLYYASDEQLSADPALGQWVAELAVMPGVRQLAGDPVTLDGLERLISALIYMVTVDHEIVDSGVWDYHLWSDVTAPRVYRDDRPLPVDIYQRLVNANFILNVDRTLLASDFSYLALDDDGREEFVQFRAELLALQLEMDQQPPAAWRIEPRNLKANINY